MAIVNTGYACNDTVDDREGSAGLYEDLVFISEYNPASEDGIYATFCIRTTNVEWPDAIDVWIQFAFYEKEQIDPQHYKFTKGSTSDKFKITRTYNSETEDVTWTANSSDVWFTKNSETPYQQTVTFGTGDVILTKLHNQNVEVTNGERLGVIFGGVEYWEWYEPPGYYLDEFIDSKTGIGGYYYMFISDDYSFRTDEDPYAHNANALALSTVGASGSVPDACQNITNKDEYYVGDTVSGWGSAYISAIGDDPYQALVNLITPWGEGITSEVFYDGVTRTFHDDSGMQHWSLKLYIACFGSCLVFNPYECWWSDKSIYYVKTTGSDSNFGSTWAKAFKTITKGAQTVPDSGTLMIEEGTYNNETQIQPTVDNATYNIQPTSHTEAACTVTINLT